MPPKVVLKTLDKLWAALEPLGLPMAIMGGLALAAWKYADYLLTCTRQLQLENELLEIWDEAFPGQTPSS